MSLRVASRQLHQRLAESASAGVGASTSASAGEGKGTGVPTPPKPKPKKARKAKKPAAAKLSGVEKAQRNRTARDQTALNLRLLLK